MAPHVSLQQTHHRESLHCHGYCSTLLWQKPELQIFIRKINIIAHVWPTEGNVSSLSLSMADSRTLCKQTWCPCDFWSITRNMSIKMLLSTWYWIPYDCRDLYKHILSSFVSLFDFCVAQCLGFAHSLANNFKGGSLVSCNTVAVCAEVSLNLLPHLLLWVQLFVRFTCNQEFNA